jgi:D-glycero-alpha-D-manno-heptose-7-phosphate kinase
MNELKREAVQMKECLLTGNVRGFGEVFRIGWESKKKTAGQVTNPRLEEIYSTVISAGAYSGKVSGAGGGGFMMFVVDPARRPDVWRALRKMPGTIMRAQFTDQGAAAWRSK